MVVSMRTTSVSWEGMPLSLALCVLLLHGGIRCQETPTVGTVSAFTVGAITTIKVAADSSATDNGKGIAVPTFSTQGSNATEETKDSVDNTTVTTAAASTDVMAENTTPESVDLFKIITVLNFGVFGTTTGPEAGKQDTTATDLQGERFPEGWAPVQNEPNNPAEHDRKVTELRKPTVECVDEDTLKNKDVVIVELTAASSCSDTKKIFEEAVWCPGDCKLQVFQDKESDKLVLARADGPVKEVMERLNEESTKRQLGVVKATHQPEEKSSIVLVSVLIAGLLLAAGLIGAYCVKNNHGHNAKGMRLAEEAYPVDEENQGNTLLSVAPLNPPESVEKPVNGEPQEAAKTQPPPTNGHPTTKTADTEL